MQFIKTLLILLLSTMITPLDGQTIVRPEDFPVKTVAEDTDFTPTRVGGNNRRILFSTQKKYFTPDVEPSPVGFTPTSTGNTLNLMQFVEDPSGNYWYIDSQGDAFQLSGGGGGDPVVGGDLTGTASNAQIAAAAVTANELAPSGVTAGTYGSTSQVPVITLDEDGRATNIGVANIQAGSSATIDGVSNPGGDINLVAGANVTITPDDVANTVTIAANAGGGGLGDGDYGDIILGGGSTVMDIDAGVVGSTEILDGSISLGDLDFVPLTAEVDGDPDNEKDLDDHTGTIATAQIEDGAVTLGKTAPGTGNRLVGYNSAGDPVAYSAGANITILDGVLSANSGISGLTGNHLPKSNASGDGLEDSDIYSHAGDIGINKVPAGEAVLQVQTTSVQPFIELYYANGVLASQWGNTVGDSSMFFDVERPGAGIVFRLDGNDERMRIDGPTGNVGILSQSPAVELDVTGDIRTSGQVQFEGSSNYINNDIAGNLAIVTGAGNKISFNAEGGSTDLDIDATGTSIGTVLHANRLDVEGGAAVGAGFSGTAIAPANGLIVEGILGVGTSSPEAGIHIEDVGAYEILRSTNGSLSSRITFENEADDGDSWQLRRDPGGSFTIGHSALQPYGTESIVVVMTPEEFRTYTNSILVENISAATASALSVNNGRFVYVNSTDGTFTSPGFWGVEDGAWIKL